MKISIVALTMLCATSVQAQQPSPSAESSPAPAFVDEGILKGTSARASKVIGAKVYRGGNEVGTIKDVLVDFTNATVPAVIIGVGGLLGINEKQIAVPAATIKVGKEASFTVDLTEDQLKAAPAFNPSKL